MSKKEHENSLEAMGCSLLKSHFVITVGFQQNLKRIFSPRSFYSSNRNFDKNVTPH